MKLLHPKDPEKRLCEVKHISVMAPIATLSRLTRPRARGRPAGERRSLLSNGPVHGRHVLRRTVRGPAEGSAVAEGGVLGTAQKGEGRRASGMPKRQRDSSIEAVRLGGVARRPPVSEIGRALGRGRLRFSRCRSARVRPLPGGRREHARWGVSDAALTPGARSWGSGGGEAAAVSGSRQETERRTRAMAGRVVHGFRGGAGARLGDVSPGSEPVRKRSGAET